MATKTSNATTKAKKQTTSTKKTTKKLPEIKVVEKKKIVFLGSEAAPFIATGGLADVLGSLPKALAKNKNNDVSVILPLYSAIKKEFRDEFKFLTNFNVSVSWRWQYAGVFYYEYQGVKFYFIDNEYYFKREGNIYGFYDDGERFAFFSRAAIDTLAHLEIYPDVLHCNDWQTAASIIYLKGMYYADEKLNKIKTVFTIHNIEYQGIFNMFTFGDVFGFPDAIRDTVEFNGNVNLMKGAIEMSNIVSTVSPTYAEEIKTSYFAHGLEGIINRNAHKLYGILNGIDIDYYNAETDAFLFKNYTVDDLSGKAVCKRELQTSRGEEIIDNNKLDAVISMPSGVFKPYAGVSTAVLVFKKDPSGTKDVWFYDMQADGFSLDDKRSETKENDIPDVVARFHNRDGEAKRERSEKSFFVPKAEIVGNDYDLSINKYKKTEYKPVEYAPTSEIIAELSALENEIVNGLKELAGVCGERRDNADCSR